MPTLLPGRRAAVTAFAVALPLLAAAAPALPEPARGVLMALFDPLCHQLPERSFAVAGVAMALCQRCFGVAAGVAGGAVLAPRLAPLVDPSGGRGLPALALAALPMVADWALHAAGLWVNSPASRFATGAAFGIVAGAILVLAAARPAVSAGGG